MGPESKESSTIASSSTEADSEALVEGHGEERLQKIVSRNELNVVLAIKVKENKSKEKVRAVTEDHSLKHLSVKSCARLSISLFYGWISSNGVTDTL